MQNTKVLVKAVYKVDVPREAFDHAISARGDEEFVNRELSSLVLVELEITGADHRFDLSEFKQPHTQYVPYDETFFDIRSGKVIEPNISDPSGTRDFVVVFFLHFFDPNQPLETPYGNFSFPVISPLPDRLRWKEYTYWC
jgi:hypothetical protein